MENTSTESAVETPVPARPSREALDAARAFVTETFGPLGTRLGAASPVAGQPGAWSIQLLARTQEIEDAGEIGSLIVETDDAGAVSVRENPNDAVSRERRMAVVHQPVRAFVLAALEGGIS